MYVCICKSVTDKQIRRAAARGVDNLYELRESLRRRSRLWIMRKSCPGDIAGQRRWQGSADALRSLPRLSATLNTRKRRSRTGLFFVQPRQPRMQTILVVIPPNSSCDCGRHT